MYEACCFADIFSEVSGEGDDVVVSGFFNFVDAFDGEGCMRFDFFHRVLRNGTHLRVDFADGNLHVQPLLELALLAPKRTHFRKCVPIDHKTLSTDYGIRTKEAAADCRFKSTQPVFLPTAAASCS